MPSLKDIKRRIRSVKNTQQITKAMKLVSASKLRKAQEAIVNARPFALNLRSLMNHLAARCNKDLHPLLNEPKGNKMVLLIITADKGLCGAFNGSIIRRATKVIKENSDKEITLIVAGKKGWDIFKSRDTKIIRDYKGWTRDFDYLKAADIGNHLAEIFVAQEADEIFMVYNEFKSVMQQEVVVERILPVVPEEVDSEQSGGFVVDYIYEPDEESILDGLLKRYMTDQVYRAFLESLASEHGSRMTAMDSATRNAGEMITDLSLTYNKARQAYITKELIEIVNGAAALEG